MSTLSNEIENFIKEMMAEEQMATVQRNELADYFGCAPSQINYVLTTRFSPDRGYIVESRRGGGGYIKVIKISMDEHAYIKEIIEKIQGGITERTAKRIIEGLAEAEIIDIKNARCMFAAVSDRALFAVAGNRDRLRAHILKQMLLTLLV